MEFIIWLVFGAVVGWVASLIMKTNDQQGLILDIVVGMIGAVIGGWIMSALGQSAGTGINFYSFAVALLGAVVLIGIVKAVRRA